MARFKMTSIELEIDGAGGQIGTIIGQAIGTLLGQQQQAAGGEVPPAADTPSLRLSVAPSLPCDQRKEKSAAEMGGGEPTSGNAADPEKTVASPRPRRKRKAIPPHTPTAMASIPSGWRPSAPRPTNGDGKPARKNAARLVCREQSGVMSLEEAAELAGVKRVTIYGGLTRAKARGEEWAACGEYHFKRADAEGLNLGEARPCHDGTSTPINPRVRGGAAPITHGERPTPAHIAAD